LYFKSFSINDLKSSKLNIHNPHIYSQIISQSYKSLIPKEKKNGGDLEWIEKKVNKKWANWFNLMKTQWKRVKNVLINVNDLIKLKRIDRLLFSVM